MGKQSKQPTYISQEQFDKDLDSSLNILIEDGADDKTISIYIDDYKSRYAVKKKEDTPSESTTKTPSTELVQKSGSSVTQKSVNKTLPIDEFGVTNFNVPRENKEEKPSKKVEKPIESLTKTDTLGATTFGGENTFAPEVDLQAKGLDKVKVIQDEYNRATTIPQEKDLEFEQEYNAKVNNEGLLNKAKTGLKTWWNNVAGISPTMQISTDLLIDEKKEAYSELRKELEGKEPTPQQIEQKTKEIFISNKKDNYRQSLSNDYISSLSEEDRQAVEVKLAKELPSLDKDYVNKSNSFILIGKDIDALEKSIEEDRRVIKAQEEMGNTNINPKIYDDVNKKIDLLKNKYIVAQSIEKDLDKSKAKLGTVADELDNFKRSYGTIDVMSNRLKSGIANIGYGIKSFRNYADRADIYFGTNIDGINREIPEIEQSEKDVDFAKKVIEKEEGYFRKRLNEVNGISDVFDYTADVVGDQIPNMLPFMLTGGLGGGAVIFGSSAGNQYATMMDGQINETPLSRVYTDEQKVVAPFIFASADTFLSTIPTWGRMMQGKRVMQAALKESNGLSLFNNSAMKVAKKELEKFPKAYLGENAEELSATGIQNLTNVFYLKEDGATMLDGMEQTFEDTTTFQAVLSIFPVMMGGVIRSVSSKSETAKMDDNAKAIIALKQKINQGDITDSQKSIIQSQIDKKVSENSAIISGIQKKMKSKGDVFVGKVNEVNKEIDKKLTQAKEIQSSNLEKNEKKVILDGLAQDYTELNKKREYLLSDESTAVDVLPLKEQEKLKKEAMGQLVTELNPEGDKDITITNEQVVERANKLYKEEVKQKQEDRKKPLEPLKILEENAENEVPIAEVEQEAQPQAEKQAEVVEIDSLVEENNLVEKEIEGTYVSDLIGKRVNYKDPITGEDKQGDTYLIGQTLVVEDNNGNITDLGNIVELSKLEDNTLSISEVTPTITINKNRELVYEGENESIEKGSVIKPQGEGLKSIRKDKNGNITRVVVTDNKGNTVNLKGQEAIDLAYMLMMDIHSKNGLTKKIESNAEIKQEIENEYNGQVRKTTEVKTNENTDEIKQGRNSGGEVANEATPTNTTPANEDVSIGIDKVGEVGVEQKPTAEVVAEEVVQPANEPQPIKQKEVVELPKEPTLEEISAFLETNFKQDESNKKTKNGSLPKNSKVGKVEEPKKQAKKPSRRGKTPLDKRKIKDKEMLSALAIEVFDAYGLAQQYFISGGRVLPSEIKKLLNNSISEAKARLGFARKKENKGSTIDGIAHYLWENYGEMLNLDTMDFVNAIEEVISGFTSTKAMAVDLNERYGIKFEENNIDENEFYADAKALNEVGQKDHNEALSYLDVMTDEEIAQLADEQMDFEKFLTEEANKEVVDALKQKFNVDVDVDAVKAKVEGKNNEQEKITEDQLPTKKGEKATIKLSENVDAVVTIGKDLSGEPTMVVSIFKDGELQEDKFGDTETEFSTKEKSEVLKYLESKKKGYELANKGKKGKVEESKSEVESGKNVTFELFGETKTGVLQSDGSIIGIDGTRYTPSMVKNVEEQKPATKKELGIIKDQLDKWDSDLENFGRDVLGMNLPIVIARVAIKAMKLAVNTAQTSIDVVKAGVEAIKATDWYKKLPDNKKNLIDENVLNSLIKRTIDATKELDKKIDDLRQKIKDGKASKRQIVNDVNSFIALNAIDGILTPTQARVLIKKSNKILVARDTVKAFDEFVDYYNKVKTIALAKKNKGKKQQLDFDKVNQQVNDMMSQGKTKQEIIDSFKTILEKEAAEDIITRIEAVNLTDEQAKKKSDAIFDKSLKRIEDAQKRLSDIWSKVKNWKTRLFDSMNEVKRDARKFSKDKFKSSQFTKLEELMIVAKGASGKALLDFNNKTKKIYSKLNSEDKNNLHKIIQLRRFISIDSNREQRGLNPIKHPGFINGIEAQKTLSQMEKDFGKEKFDDLMNRADIYFNTFREILDAKEKAGLISKETRDQLFNIDYQPRMFLEFVLDADGNFDFDKNDFINKSGNMSKEQIKSLKDGSVGDMMLDSEFLLGAAMEKHNKAVFANWQNTKIIEDFLDAQQEIEKLKNSNRELTKDEKKRLKDFNDVKEIIIDNPITGVTNSGNAKYKYSETPKGYNKTYYFKNGVRHEFFLKEDLHDSLMGNNKFDALPLNNSAMKFMLVFPKTLKALATGRNAFFFVTNAPRDYWQTLTFSPEFSAFKPLAFFQLNKGLVKAIYNYATNSERYQKYFEYGGSMEFLSSQGDLNKKSIIKDIQGIKGVAKMTNALISPKAKDIAKTALDIVTLHEVNLFSEISFRYAIFNKAIENRLSEMGVKKIEDLTEEEQKDVYISAVASARSIMNFSEGGTYTKAYEPLLPYLNAGVQGSRVMYEAFEKRPAETSLAVLQTTVMGLLPIIGTAFALIGVNKDDDDERNVMEIYLDNLETVSDFEKQNFHIIFDGTYNDEGMPNFIRIAKTQQLTPFMSVSEYYIQNHFREISGRKPKNDLFDKIFNATKDNMFILPIDPRSPDKFLKSGGKIISKNPLAGGMLTYFSGYDYFREQPLSFDINKTTVRGEGLKSSRVESFYKKLGEETGVSPIRTKAAVESIMTSPSTNYLMGMLYGGLDAIITDPVFKDTAKSSTDKTIESVGRRVYRSGSDFNRELNMKKEFEKEYDDAKYDMEKQDAEISKIAKDLYEKVLDKNEIKEKVKKVILDDPVRAESTMKKIENRTKDKFLTGIERDLKYETDKRLLAIRLYSYYGDVTKMSPEKKKEFLSSANKSGIMDRLNSEEFLMQYKKIVEQNKPSN